MKKFIYKNLSVILSLAIVICTIMPVLSTVIKADSTYTPEDIVELKSAWEALSNVEIELIPSEVKGVPPITLIDSDEYQGTDLTDKSVLGDKYATYHCSGGGCSDDIDYVIFKTDDGKTNSSLTLGQLNDFTVYIKNSSGINMRPKFHYEGAEGRINNDPSFFKSAQYTKNEWNEFKLSSIDSFGTLMNTLKTKADNIFEYIGFDCGTESGDMTIGTLFANFDAVSDSTLALSETNAEAFINKAYVFYADAKDNGYYDDSDEAFIRFTNALSAVTDDVDCAVVYKDIKENWGKLSFKEIFNPLSLTTGQAFTLQDASSYVGGDLADKGVLGGKYITYTVTSTSASDNKDSVKFYLPTTDYKFGQIKDFTVYLKTTVANTVRPYFNYDTETTAAYNGGSVFAANTDIKANQWNCLKMSNLPQQTQLKSVISGLRDKSIKSINFDFSGASEIILGSMIIELDAVTEDTLALYESDREAFLESAVDFYINAKSRQLFAADDTVFNTFSNAIVSTGIDLESAFNINELKTAWMALPSFEVSLIPNRVAGNSDIKVYTSSEYQGNDLPDKTVLGEKYAAYHSEGGNAGDWKDQIYFSFENGNGSILAEQLEGYSVYIKSSGEIGIRPRVSLLLEDRWYDPNFYSASFIGVNSWKQLKMSDLGDQTKLWSQTNAEEAVKPSPIQAVAFDCAGVSDLLFGTMTASFNAIGPTTLALAETNKSDFIDAATIFYVDCISNEYYDSDNSAFKKFENILKTIVKDLEYDILINKIYNSWLSLPDAKVALIPNQVLGDNQLSLGSTASYGGNDIDKALLGESYATYTVASTACSDDKDYIYFNQKNRNLHSFKLEQLKSFSFYAKTSSAISMRPKVHYLESRVYNDPSFFDGSKYAVNTWNEYKMDDLSSAATFKNTFLGKGDRIFESVAIDCGGTPGNIVIGSMTAVFSSVSNEVLALKDTNAATFIGEAIKYVQEAKENGYYSADCEQFLKFADAVESIRKLEGFDEILAVAELQAAWKLLDIGSYPSVDTSAWTIGDWVYAANKVDTTNLAGSENFTAALRRAVTVRDALNLSLGCNIINYSNIADLSNVPIDFANNLITKANIKAYYFDGTNKPEIENSDFSQLYDGVYDSEYEAQGVNIGDAGAYFEIIFAFDGNVTVDDFLIGNSANESLRNFSYKIFASNTIDKLFLSDSIVAYVENTENAHAQILNYDGRPQISGSYFAIRIYKPCADMNNYDEIIRLSEFGIYGSYSLYNVTAGRFTNEEMASFGSSLLKDNNVNGYVKAANGAKSKWTNTTNDTFNYPINNITDLNNDTAAGLGAFPGTAITKSGEEINIHIFFDLKDTYHINKIFINHWHENYLQTGKYNIKISENYATLFKDESTVVEYNNMSDSENGTTLAQLFEAVGSGAVGRYISFNITVPINDYKNSLERFGTLAWIRLCDVAVYGVKYQKPLKEINFLNHMPVELYRTDANGNKVAISVDEYGGTDYLNAADGKYDVATPISQNGKTIDILFNLCSNKTINSIKLSTLTENVKGLKVYASQSVEGVWNEESCVMNYSAASAEDTEISRAFAEEPITARYVRFSITDTESGVFDPTEFEVIGWNSQEFYYYNVAEDKGSMTSVYLENKDNFNLRSTSSTANEYSIISNIYSIDKAFDNDSVSVADFFGGSLGDKNGKGKESINLSIDLGSLVAIDEIEFISGSSPDYWPTEINFYVGDDELLLFGKDAKPVAQFKEKCQDESGSYKCVILPQVVQYVRVEIVNSTQKYYEFTNMVATVIEEIKIGGFDIMGNTSSEGVAASITDEETGIRADVVALRENDVFSKVQGISVIYRPASAEERKHFASQSVVFASDIYDIYLLDANGNIISDTEGRNIRINLPKSLFKGVGDPYIIANIDGQYTMVEFETDGEYYTVVLSDAYNLSVAFCEFSDIVLDDDVPPTDTDNTVTDEDETETEDEEEETSKKKRKKVKVVRKGNGTDIFDYLWIIIVVVAVVIVAAGVTLFIILAKKKKKQEEEK